MKVKFSLVIHCGTPDCSGVRMPEPFLPYLYRDVRLVEQSSLPVPECKIEIGLLPARLRNRAARWLTGGFLLVYGLVGGIPVLPLTRPIGLGSRNAGD